MALAGRGKPWTEQEIDLIVADYFVMRDMELRGEKFVKSQRNAALREHIDRSAGSIEFKHQNISAVLRELGEPWIVGYKPAVNFQRALLEGIERYLDAQASQDISTALTVGSLAEQAPLYTEQAPRYEEADELRDKDIVRLVRKFDPAGRDERNRRLGRSGEERVVYSERKRLQLEGREDLAKQVRWVADLDGDGAGYDVLSFNRKGEERHLEVKTTNGHNRTPFYISRNELSFSHENSESFRLYRVYDFAREPKAFVIKPPLEDRVRLRPTAFQASF